MLHRPLHTLMALASLAALSALPACAGTGNSRALKDPGPGLLPATTQAWVGIANPKRAFHAVDRDAYAELYGEEYTQFRKEADRKLGLDPYDPASLTEAGLDINRPAGAALLDMKDEVGALYAHVASLPKLLVTLDKLARSMRGSRVSEPVGQGTVHRFGERGRRAKLCVAVRGDLMTVFFTDRSRAASRIRGLCYAAAAGPVTNSLAAKPGFRTSMGRPRHGRDGYGFVNVEGLVAATLGLDRPPEGELSGGLGRIIGFYESLNDLAFGIDLDATKALLDLWVSRSGGALKPVVNAPAGETNTSFRSVDGVLDATFRFTPGTSPDWFFLALVGQPLGAAYRGWFPDKPLAELRRNGLDFGVLAGVTDGSAGLATGCQDATNRRSCGALAYVGLRDPAPVQATLKPGGRVQVVGGRLVVHLGGNTKALAAGAVTMAPTTPALEQASERERFGRLRIHGREAWAGFLREATMPSRFSGESAMVVRAQPLSKAAVEAQRKLERAFAKRTDAHFKPLEDAWAQLAKGLGWVEVAMVAHGADLQLIGGTSASGGAGSWGDLARKAKAVKAIGQRLVASFRVLEEAHERAIQKAGTLTDPEASEKTEGPAR